MCSMQWAASMNQSVQCMAHRHQQQRWASKNRLDWRVVMMNNARTYHTATTKARGGFRARLQGELVDLVDEELGLTLRVDGIGEVDVVSHALLILATRI